MAGEVGIRRFTVLGNKVANDEERAFLENAIPEGEYVGALPFSETIRRADREDVALVDAMDVELRQQFQALWDQVKARSEG
jgi:hypothetical protein